MFQQIASFNYENMSFLFIMKKVTITNQVTMYNSCSNVKK